MERRSTVLLNAGVGLLIAGVGATAAGSILFFGGGSSSAGCPTDLTGSATPGCAPTQKDSTMQIAGVATIGILQERAIHRSEVVNEQLQAALNSRVMIEQAKGVLAQHLGLSMDEAFTQLRDYDRGHNLPLADVARLLATRQLDPRRLIPPAPQPRRTDRRRHH